MLEDYYPIDVLNAYKSLPMKFIYTGNNQSTQQAVFHNNSALNAKSSTQKVFARAIIPRRGEKVHKTVNINKALSEVGCESHS